jgi:hypothetical protein
MPATITSTTVLCDPLLHLLHIIENAAAIITCGGPFPFSRAAGQRRLRQAELAARDSRVKYRFLPKIFDVPLSFISVPPIFFIVASFCPFLE